jgi:insertion element IS1 protein InsB
MDVLSQLTAKERHIISKADTHAIERDHPQTRHQLARLTRQTKLVSKS